MPLSDAVLRSARISARSLATSAAGVASASTSGSSAPSSRACAKHVRTSALAQCDRMKVSRCDEAYGNCSVIFAEARWRSRERRGRTRWAWSSLRRFSEASGSAADPQCRARWPARASLTADVQGHRTRRGERRIGQQLSVGGWRCASTLVGEGATSNRGASSSGAATAQAPWSQKWMVYGRHTSDGTGRTAERADRPSRRGAATRPTRSARGSTATLSGSRLHGRTPSCGVSAANQGSDAQVDRAEQQRDASDELDGALVAHAQEHVVAVMVSEPCEH